jgi:hypothetical protein
MLNESQFNELTMAEKYRLVMEHGCFLIHRIHESYKVCLYKTGHFLVEIWYSNRDEISDIQTTSLQKILYHYFRP